MSKNNTVYESDAVAELMGEVRELCNAILDNADIPAKSTLCSMALWIGHHQYVLGAYTTMGLRGTVNAGVIHSFLETHALARTSIENVQDTLVALAKMAKLAS